MAQARVERRVVDIFFRIGHELAQPLAFALATSVIAAFYNDDFDRVADEHHIAKAQRPLWASTGVKDPAYPDTMYVAELVAPDTVNTMPGATLEAFADHGQVDGNTISGDGCRLHLDGGSVSLDLGLSEGIRQYIKDGAKV